MNAQAVDFGSMHPVNKVMSITTIAYKFITIVFMCTCMVYFYKTYKYNVGIFQMQKQLNNRFSVEDNYNGATANIEYSDESILSQSQIDHPKLVEEADFGIFVFNYLERVFNVQNDTYVYNKDTNILVQIVPANNNVGQKFLHQLKDWYVPKNVDQFECVVNTGIGEAQKEYQHRIQLWVLQQKIKKEKEEAMMNQDNIINDTDVSNTDTTIQNTNGFKVTNVSNIDNGGGSINE